MARTARAEASPPPLLPWHKRYRLLVQLGGLAAVVGILALIVLLLWDSGTPVKKPNVQLAANRPVVDAVFVTPADLPGNWDVARGGLGLQGNLREANLGAATTIGESQVGTAAGWVEDGGQGRFLSAGIIVTDSPLQARAAFDRLATATPEETLRYVESQDAELVNFIPGAVAPASADRFGFLIAYDRGTQVNPDNPDEPGPQLIIGVTVIWQITGRSLVYVALNEIFVNPPPPPPVDMAVWLSDVAASIEAAEIALAAANAAGEAGP